MMGNIVIEFLDVILIPVPNSSFQSHDSTLNLNLRVLISLKVSAAAVCCDINNESNHILGEEQVLMLVYLYFLCRNQQAQLISSLNMVLGNKPNLTLTIEGIKPVSELKTQVVIYVQEKSVTGSV
jgi:hypothetical protein